MEILRETFAPYLYKSRDFVISYGLRLGLALVLLILGLKLTARLMVFLKKEIERYPVVDSSFRGFILAFLQIFFKFLLVMMVAGLLGIKTTFFLTVLGSIGLAIGLALQGSLSNVAGGILILFFRPFRVGDFIEISGNQGRVQEIQILWTTLISPDNKMINLPNGPLVNGILINHTRPGQRRIDIIFPLELERKAVTPRLEMAKTLLFQTALDDTRIARNPAPAILVKEMTTASSKVVLQVWCSFEDFELVSSDLLEKGNRALAEAGGEGPAPT